MIGVYVQQLRRFSRDARLVTATGALISFNILGIYGVLLNLYLLRLGYGPKFVGLLSAAGWLAWGAVSLPAGALGGRWGVRRLMIVGVALATVGRGLLPLAELLPHAMRPGWLVSGSVLGNLGTATWVVTFSPFLIGASGGEERDHVFSVFFALVSLFSFAGSTTAGLLPGLFGTILGVSLDQPSPYRYALFVAVALMVPGIWALLATREGVAAKPQRTRDGVGQFPFTIICLMALVYLLRSAGEGVMLTFFNVYLDDGIHVSTALIGAVMASGQLVSILTALVVPILIARLGKGRTILLGLLGMALGLLPSALIRHWIAAGVGFACFSAMLSIINATFYVFSQEAVSPGWRPAMSGALTTAQGASLSALALGGGYAITAFGYRSPFLIAAGLTMAGALIFWSFYPRVQRGELVFGAASAHSEHRG
jgi:MFS family permease